MKEGTTMDTAMTSTGDVAAALGLKDATLLRSQACVAGQWVGADDGRTHAIRNPATGALVAEVPDMGAAETRRAIEGAQAAWPAWKSKTAKERAAVLRRWYELMLQNQEDLARILTAEQGKPLAEARGEIGYAASFIEWFAEEGKRVYGDVIPSFAADKRIVVVKEGIGVTAAITPWNFPAAMITRKIGPALAAGCPMVIKPAPQTPLSAFALAVLAERAGVPAGIVSVVSSGEARAAEIGTELTANPIVRKLSFTGSTAVGKKLMAQCAATVKKVSLELGGNAPFIVFDDADLDAAVRGAMISKYRNNGQTCVCANRILVQDGVYEAFAAKLGEAVKALRVGHGTEDGVTTGPLINPRAVEKVEDHIRDALEKGARIIAGGKRHTLGGTFFEPTILADVTSSMKVAREETFGPVAPLFRFHAEEEAVRMANDTEFGLAAYFYTRDVGRVWRVGEALEYGIVGINEGIISTEVAPFGGVKESGIGREGSRYGMEDYLEIKYMLMGGV
ncbi:MAG TPA: NAD-dependent succinate-semialdehyde dehydrogenase [Azospirillaceae bacterium]|nr:NAD-dependent succinate-semialdehyde dehydrogenase [Azospirillaceae bacterium]